MKARYFVLLVTFFLVLSVCACGSKTPDPDSTPTTEAPTEAPTEATTEVETEDLFADVDVEGHTLKMVNGIYCIEPKVQGTYPDGAAVITNVILKDLNEFREKLLKGGFTEDEYMRINGWPKAANGVIIPNPNALREVALPDDWKQASVLWTGSTYTFIIEDKAGTMFAFFNMIRPEQFKPEYESAKVSVTMALLQKDGTKEEGSFNGIPCTVYEYTPPYAPEGTTIKNRAYWLDLSNEKEQLFVAIELQPEDPKSPLLMELVGKMEDGTAYTITFHCPRDEESLKTYTAEWFRSFRPASLK